jgi:UDPglucose 6-dehydrogenase
LRTVKEVNEQERSLFVEKIEEAVWILKGKTIAILGLAFKPHTDDIRFAPSIDIIEKLKSQGAKIRVHDPVAMERGEAVLKDVTFCKTPYEAVQGADCLALVTEWPQFKSLDFKKIKKAMTHPILIDGRNLYDPEKMKALGFEYHGMGRAR